MLTVRDSWGHFHTLLYFSISLRAGAKPFCFYRPCYGMMIVTILESTDKILRCYHSNGFLWQNVCMVIPILSDFTERNLTFFFNFFFRNFFGVRGLKGLKKIGNLLYQCLIYNPSLKKNRTKEKNQWYSFLNYRTHYTILRISRSIK